jgi:hypothetical protein
MLRVANAKSTQRSKDTGRVPSAIFLKCARFLPTFYLEKVGLPKADERDEKTSIVVYAMNETKGLRNSAEPIGC